ncbi:hypothetical protein AVEN_156541-1 [Araneus ventricosus]|uniref:Uncharacterized protein n=1 Tax=Araneus ventricosus TaxID=182803 RepID=A0A4Y2PCK8_ARAVE|nr:hypothetical protein AVEN_156541-1 [Araneus ventricosus]
MTPLTRGSSNDPFDPEYDSTSEMYPKERHHKINAEQHRRHHKINTEQHRRHHKGITAFVSSNPITPLIQVQDITRSTQNNIEDITSSTQNNIEDIRRSTQNNIEDITRSTQNSIADITGPTQNKHSTRQPLDRD